MGRSPCMAVPATIAPVDSPLAPRTRPAPARPGKRSPPTTPRLSIVVVNYRQWDKTHELVRQLLATAAVRTGAAEVVIVDNHSPAHPLARRLRRLPGVS